IRVETKSGQIVKGDVQDKTADFITLSKGDSSILQKINREEILSLEQTPPVRDEAGNLISEKEIRKNKSRKNFLIFTFGGGALSFGASFFLTANLQHALAGNSDGMVLWSSTGLGTLLGTFLFSHQGNKIDRRHAIERIKEERKQEALRKMEEIQQQRGQINQELERLKADRKKQDEEIERLLKQIEEKGKEKKPESNNQ
ncbi:MAG: hypothetical protein ONB05_00230, partial [candidate division KSB1 bacterium]|nr:hypothetical protein [candidate division KSB1 bacterium]